MYCLCLCLNQLRQEAVLDLLTIEHLHSVLKFASTSVVDQIDTFLADLSTFLVRLVASCFLLDTSSTIRSLLNLVGVWIVRSAIVINAAVSVCRTVGLVVGLVKAYAERMKLVQAKYITTPGLEGRQAEVEESRNATNWLEA